MKRGFVPIENYRRLSDAYTAAEKRGASEAGLVIITGTYAVGKSYLLERWASDSGAVFTRCKETWTKRSLLDEVAERLGIDTRGRNSEVQARIITRLAMKALPLVFDEADFLIRSTPSLLECIRDITDVTGVTCFLAGMDRFADKIAKYGHIASRVARIVELQPLSLADVTAAVKQICELPVEDEAVALLHAQCAGRMRLVLNGIATLEQWAETNDWKTITAAQIGGLKICVEFTGREPARSLRRRAR